jgi:hypothetical protein
MGLSTEPGVPVQPAEGFVMAKRSGSSFMKRQKETARQQRQQDKMARRLAKKKEDPEGTPGEAGPVEDPDIAGIIPGPQPPSDTDY